MDFVSANDRSLRNLGRAIIFSQGQFSLVVVCCNYLALQEQILQQLEEISLQGYQVQRIVVPRNAISLYTNIHSQVTDEQPSVLMILGLESVNALDDLLTGLNHVRDELRKRHPFPMVFWVNDEVLQKMVRLSPDFASWAATPIKFDMTTTELLLFLEQKTNSLFSEILNVNSVQSAEHQILSYNNTLDLVWRCRSYEFCYAVKDLQNRGVKLESELNAGLEFVFGLEDYVGDRINSALKHFQPSLQFWQQQLRQEDVGGGQFTALGSPIPPSPHRLREGVLLFYIGLCYFRLFERNNSENLPYWLEAKSCFQQCVRVFEVAGREDIVARYIVKLCEVLQQLQEWEELQVVAEKSLELHQTFGTQIQLARDYGFLAEVAVQYSNWAKASQFAQMSLFSLKEARATFDSEQHQGLFPLLLEQIYQLVLAQALERLGEKNQALEHLKMAYQQLGMALETSDYRYDAYRYIRLLQRLRSLYFQSSRYLEAFCIKQKWRSVEQQYGLRAFIGAGRLQPQRQATNPMLVSPSALTSVALEIAASGRHRDIHHLIGRMSRSDQKLTVIHGPSGVGKSSTVTAGLVPELQNRAIGDQKSVPVVVQVYTNWVRELGESLTQALLLIQNSSTGVSSELIALNSIEAILAQLQVNAKNHWITVLIFDQFEEFFLNCPQRDEQQKFDLFICNCLNISFVKIIFSLREEYLSRLLDFKHLAEQETINHNILDKNIRYQLKNFAKEDAKNVIVRLTERSHFHPESALIDALVEDLSAELGEVRPIELQVVGSQLQDERITSLAEYQKFRPNKLIERYIRELIKECGSDNEGAALLILYLLTDEDKKRPFKTHTELTTQLAELEQIEKIELVLEILVRSGLVVLFLDVTERRYQLIHDYLVDLIRYLQQQTESNLQTQLKELRDHVYQRETEISQLKSQLKKKQQQPKLVESQPQQGLNLLTELKELRKRETESQIEIAQLYAELQQQKLQAELSHSKATVNRFLKIALAGSLVSILVVGYFWRQAVISEIRAISATSEALLASPDKETDALKEGLKAARKLQRTAFILPDADTRSQVMTALYQVVPREKERLCLEGHTAGVNSISYSPDGKIIASASADKTIKLWHSDGQLFQTLKGHRDVVNNISFSPDGKMIASASQDKTVKLWNLKGKLLTTLKGHTDVVNSVSFTRDNNMIASASSDKTIKLWRRDGKLIKTLQGHQAQVLGVAWSPDGQILASASTDNTIILWSVDGRQLKILTGHNDAVRSVAWSQDGKAIASGSLDKTVKLWNRDGNLLRTLSGHNDKVTSVNFSPDGSTIASTSTDRTIKLWRRDGLLLKTIKGHKDWVNSVSFSPDGKTLASASTDRTAKLWDVRDVWLPNKSHRKSVTSVSFSHQGDLIASASEDNTIKFWSREGTLLRTLEGHKGEVWGISFSPYDNMLASASKDKTVKLWSRDGQLLKTLSGHNEFVLSVAWSPLGNIIASASKDKTVKLWSRDGRLLRNLPGHKDTVNWVSFSPDGELLASASDDRTVKLWRQDGSLLKTLASHEGAVYGVAWSPDGRKIASASVDGTVKLWSRDGKLIKTLLGHSDAVNGVSFSRDGKLLASVSDDKTVKLWNQDGVLQITLKENQDELTSVSFSPDGQLIASGSIKGTLLIQNLEDIKLKNLLVRGNQILHDYEVVNW